MRALLLDWTVQGCVNTLAWNEQGTRLTSGPSNSSSCTNTSVPPHADPACDDAANATGSDDRTAAVWTVDDGELWVPVLS